MHIWQQLLKWGLVVPGLEDSVGKLYFHLLTLLSMKRSVQASYVLFDCLFFLDLVFSDKTSKLFLNRKIKYLTF